MDQCTHEVRAEYWEGIIKSCNQRPCGQSVKKWLEDNGICEQSYYYWQRKLRQQTFELMNTEIQKAPAAIEKPDISLVEIPCIPLEQDHTVSKQLITVAVLHSASISVEITNDISDALLGRLLKELAHA